MVGLAFLTFGASASITPVIRAIQGEGGWKFAEIASSAHRFAGKSACDMGKVSYYHSS
ncbi:MAG: hypothetical protein ACKVP5_07755 [Aestuariivirga sp.]